MRGRFGTNWICDFSASAKRDYIERGWNPRWQFHESIESEFSKPAAPVESDARSLGSHRFYLLLKSRKNMKDTVSEIESIFPDSLVSVSDESEENTIIQISRSRNGVDVSEIDRTELILESIAEKYDAQYDGNEISLDHLSR